MNTSTIRELSIILGYVLIGWFLAIKAIEPVFQSSPWWTIYRLLAPGVLLVVLLGGVFSGRIGLLTRRLRTTELLTNVMQPMALDVNQRMIDQAARVLSLGLIAGFLLFGYSLFRNGSWLDGIVKPPPAASKSFKTLSMTVDQQRVWLCLLSAPVSAGKPWDDRSSWRREEMDTFDPGYTIERDFQTRQYYLRVGRIEGLTLRTDDQDVPLNGAGAAHILATADGVDVVLDAQREQVVPVLCGGPA